MQPSLPRGPFTASHRPPPHRRDQLPRIRAEPVYLETSQQKVPTVTSADMATATEITVLSVRDRNNPYLDVDVTAVFTGPQGQRLRRPGYWDGGRVWGIRFA